MLNLAYRVVGDYEEACEVVQDAFVAAYRGLATFRGEARFSTWLTTITLNQARNGLVRLKARRGVKIAVWAPVLGQGHKAAHA